MNVANSVMESLARCIITITALALLTACGDQGVPEMNKQEQETIKAYTDTLAPVCIGRFQVSMPDQMPVASSSLTVNDAKISARPMSRQMFERFIDKRKATLQATRPLNDEDRPYLKKIIEVAPDVLIIDRNEDAHSADAYRVLEGYRFNNLTMFSVEMTITDLSDDRYVKERKSLTADRSDRLLQIKYLLAQLHPLKSGEIPSAPGLCFEHGFLAGGADEKIPGAALPYREETVAMAFVDKNRRDVYFHINANSTVSTKTTLLDRSDEAESVLSNDDKFSVLRKGSVELQDINQAEEWLGTMTSDENVKGAKFLLEANSQKGSVREPRISIELMSGEYYLDDDREHLEKASLTDAEAAGLWDAVTRTFRPRPSAF